MKVQNHAGFSGPHLELIAASETASRAVPPLWPLASSVAVNPFLGQSGQSLAATSALLSRVAGVPATMPRAWYAARIESGAITDVDLDAALKAAADGPDSVSALRAAAAAPDGEITALPTVAALAARASGIDWPGLIEERIGAWAAGYFDEGQALWQVTPGRGAYQSWQIFASRDLTPEIAGLAGFAATVARMPDSARTALSEACDALGLAPGAAPTYFHQLLLGLGGWAQLARQKLWEAELAGGTTPVTSDLLTIRLIWEKALLLRYAPQIGAEWAEICAAHTAPVALSDVQIVPCILQDAAERGAQRALAATLLSAGETVAEGRPSLQAAFCIDVRSEVFRRALEQVDARVQTLGFAGFFGLTASHRAFASDVEERRLPVLLSPGVSSSAISADADATDLAAHLAARLAARTQRAWGRFKLAAVSSFAFVEATGPVYAGKLLRDALGTAQPPAPGARAPHLEGDLPLEAKVAAASKILHAMSLTDAFAPLVLIAGHGAGVVNNPHASALQCGACGGYSGDVNARLLAGLLNDAEVRRGLAVDGIDVPPDTVFLGALHDTTSDTITLFEGDARVSDGTLRYARDVLAAAGVLARGERALRLPRANADGATLVARGRDWSETRPEWALAGCCAFIAAPRSRTRGKALYGRAFLHDYDWTRDEGYGVLELILTAPVVVASWISLQYYGSVVAPDVFGGGNKLLHNVTGGIGVVEGNGGALRSGLPWQSVHDGHALAHDPLRMNVCIEAPEEAVTGILERHADVRALFDNRWMHLFLTDASGAMIARYSGDLTWEDMRAEAA